MQLCRQTMQIIDVKNNLIDKKATKEIIKEIN